MSLISATVAAAASVRTVSTSAGRLSASVARISLAPDVTVTVGGGRDQSAEIYQRIFTRTDRSTGSTNPNERGFINVGEQNAIERRMIHVGEMGPLERLLFVSRMGGR